MRVLHLTTEFPPVIYGGLGTAVGGWVQASARQGMSMGVLLIEGQLVLDDAEHALRYGVAHAPGDHGSLGERDEEGVVDRKGITFFQAGWHDAVEAGVRLARRWEPDIIHLHTAMVWPVAQAIQELLAAIPRVLEAAPNARFVLAGGPPPLSGPEVAAQWLTAELEPYLGRIHFTGWLSPSELYSWYRAADILVVPSRYEPFGMVILEGMLHGLPIVASNVGGPAEILEHGRTGLLFTPRDALGLAEALIALVRDGDLRRDMGRAGAERVRCA